MCTKTTKRAKQKKKTNEQTNEFKRAMTKWFKE